MKAAPPFFVFEGLDLTIYPSLASIEAELEGIDVDDGIYEVFDSIGHEIHLRATGVKRGGHWVEIGQTCIDGIEASPDGPGRLYELLSDHLNAIGQDVSPEAPLRLLVARCVSVHERGG